MSGRANKPSRQPLRSSSSLVLNAPSATPHSITTLALDKPAKLRAVRTGSLPILSDAEEEMRITEGPKAASSSNKVEDVIEIFTTDDETLGAPLARPRLSLIRKALPTPIRSDVTPRRAAVVPRTPRPRRVILSSSSESESEHVCLPLRPILNLKPKANDVLVISESSDDGVVRSTEGFSDRGWPTPVPGDEMDPWTKDESILELNEPKTFRRPIPRKLVKPAETIPETDDLAGSSTLPISRPPSVPGASKSSVPLTPATPKVPRAPRGKKVAVEAEQRRREVYAQALFDELNAAVFKGELPHAKLVWNKRLLTTAGRAKWHRSRTGVDQTEIELATKILDCDDRIRNTLSHEMCHLACWLISKEPKEHHGRIFKSWASQVMKKRKDIEVTTRHNYDIVYAYEWKCSTCGKIYGRHSKSINPDAVLCGSCKTGKLSPLFATREGATPRTKPSNTAGHGAAGDSRGDARIDRGASSTHHDSDSDLAELMRELVLPATNRQARNSFIQS